jgi:oligoendopeptidase F
MKNIKVGRKYFSQDFAITTWKNLQLELEKLLVYPIDSAEELLEFWQAVSELDKIVGDKEAWLYINMTRFADKEEYEQAFNQFMEKIEAPKQNYAFKLKKKFYASPWRTQLAPEYAHLNRIIANEIELFREENIPLFVKEQELATQYGKIVSRMTVSFQGEEKTVQQLAPYLEDPNRDLREAAWRLMYGRYAQDQTVLDKLFDELKSIRVQIAKNSGFENYRDYAHQAKGRFSYAPEDLVQLHAVVAEVVVPLVEEFNAERREKLGLAVLQPWDFNVDIDGKFPQPFATHEELVAKGAQAIGRVDPLFGVEIEKMRAHEFIDAENRKGKAPGGYCYPLREANSSFIFMHAVGTQRDVEVFVHEAGHAMHNRLSKDQAIFQYTNNPSEVAELASMSMELIAMDYMDIFHAPAVLGNLRKKELRDKISFLPWGVVVDAFQHWLYLHPEHSAEERGVYFAGLLDRFKIGGDWTGLEKEKVMRWMLQLHIFEVPFYYIEYVLAQLGAIAVYRNYRHDPKKAMEEYKNFLALGYAKPVTEVYATAGIPFDFSKEYVMELMDFVRGELVD